MARNYFAVGRLLTSYGLPQLLKQFFNATENGEEHGVPLPVLQAGLYKHVIQLGPYLDLPTPALKETCIASIKAAGRAKAVTTGKSTFMAVGMSSMGRADDQDEKTAEILLRILRMRPGTGEFLQHNITALNTARVQRQGAIA